MGLKATDSPAATEYSNISVGGRTVLRKKPWAQGKRVEDLDPGLLLTTSFIICFLSFSINKMKIERNALLT